MMMMPGKEKISTLIVGKLKGMEGEKSSSPEAPEKDPNEMAMESAASKLMDGVKASDPAMVVSALKDFMAMHETSEPEEEEPPFEG